MTALQRNPGGSIKLIDPCGVIFQTKKITGKNSISIYQLQVFERSLDCAVMPNLFRLPSRNVDEKVPVKEAFSNPAKTKNPAGLEQDQVVYGFV